MTNNQLLSLSLIIVTLIILFILTKSIQYASIRKTSSCFFIFNASFLIISVFNPFGFFDVSWQVYLYYCLFLLSFSIGFFLQLKKIRFNKKEEEKIIEEINSNSEKLTHNKKWAFFCITTVALQVTYAIRFIIFSKQYDNGMLARQAYYSNFFSNGLEYYFYHFILSTAKTIIEIFSAYELSRKKYKSPYLYLGLLLVIATTLTGFGRAEIVNFIFYFFTFIIGINKKEINIKKILIPTIAIVSLLGLSLIIINTRVKKGNITDALKYQVESVIEYYIVGFRNFDHYLQGNGFERLEQPTLVRGTMAGLEEIITIPVIQFTSWKETFNRIVAPQTQMDNTVGKNPENGEDIKMNAFYTCMMPLYNDLWAIGITIYAVIFGILIAHIIKKVIKTRSFLFYILAIFSFVNLIIPTIYKWNFQSAEVTFSFIAIFTIATLNHKRCTKKECHPNKPNYLINNREKILWVTNVIMPYPANQIRQKPTVFGGWLLGLYEAIKKDNTYQLAIATTYTGKKLLKFKDKGTLYYLLPCKNNEKYDYMLEFYWRKVINDFQPSLIHIHGTEYAHALALQNTCSHEKYLVSIQGLLEPCSKAYLAGLTKKEIRKNITLRDTLRGTILSSQKAFQNRAKYEKQILKNSTALTGRTKWDHDESLEIAGKKPYYKCNEILRESFYGENWESSEIEPHSIYISQASYPLKGFHILLDALPELIKKYPDTKVYVAGTNILDRSTKKKKLLLSGYAKILEGKIKNNSLKKHIIFMGELPEKEVLKRMKKCNVFIQCSSIENSSNSLGEAMLIGMPCVASNVGGTSDLLKDKEEGFLYGFGDKKELAKCIDKMFSDDKLAKKLGKNAQKHAKITHDKKTNSNTMLKIYNKVIKENE